MQNSSTASTIATETPQSPEPVKQCSLTPQQEQQWIDTMSMMAWTAPGFRHLFYKMLSDTHNQGKAKYQAVFTEVDCPIAKTDGKNLVLNPKSFFKLLLPERVYVVAHEISHNMFGDVELLHRCVNSGNVPMNDGTALPFDNDTMQKAMDARINAMLNDSRIGKAPTKLDGHPIGHYDKEVKADDTVLDVYGRYYHKKFPDGDGDEDGKGPNGQGNNPGGFDQLDKPGASTGQNPGQAASQRNNQQWAVEVSAAQQIEKMARHGKMPAHLARAFKDILEPEVNWVDYIQTLINRVVGDGSYDWTKPDPWYGVLDIYQPSPTGTGAGWIVVWGDTSGSRNDSEIASNMAELAGMLEDVNPQRLTVIWCDADIDFIDEITDPADLAHIQKRGSGGGGGTSMEPVFDWIKANADGAPDLFIGFTDGIVDFVREPSFPVIWASSTERPYPYGQVVHVNKKGRTP